jgi:hypothetical protein
LAKASLREPWSLGISDARELIVIIERLTDPPLGLMAPHSSLIGSRFDPSFRRSALRTLFKRLIALEDVSPSWM